MPRAANIQSLRAETTVELVHKNAASRILPPTKETYSTSLQTQLPHHSSPVLVKLSKLIPKEAALRLLSVLVLVFISASQQATCRKTAVRTWSRLFPEIAISFPARNWRPGGSLE